MITYILLALAGACNAIMDLSSEGLLWSDWWNKAASSDNKNQISSNKVLKWLFRNPLVFLTDGWHLFQFLCFSLFTVAIITYKDPHINWILEFIYYKLTFTTAFVAVYQPLKNAKKN